MIYEFALDPGLLSNWERFRYLTEKFGVSNGRLISRYPMRWKAMVYNGLEGVSEMDRKRIEEKLSEIDEKLLYRVQTWDPSMDWLRNAEQESEKRPFHAIIGAANPRGYDRVLPYEDLDEKHPLWESKTERVVPRTAAALASAVAPLLRISTHVVFVDPRLDPYKRQIVKTVRAFLDACIIGRLDSCRLKKVEFFTKFCDIQHFEDECRRVFSSSIPVGMKLRVTRCKERPSGGQGFHNRYILTDRGGVNFRWGLDEGRAGQTDEVSLLQPDVLKMRWEDYCGEHPAFDREQPFDIEGTRKVK